MDISGDELAGVVDLFGALTRNELGTGLAELAFKQREEYDPDGFGSDIETALKRYHLVELDTDTVDSDESMLVPGPGAFPALPLGAADLLHILDIEHRDIDRATAGAATLDRFRADAAAAVDSGNPERVERLLDVSYELEAWADVDLSAEREHLDRVV
ncbi:MAG: hypothetical protein J07HX64_02690 [halophilic archaeon J07HX64]|jgi:hypothetical protein|nr:MAG: hypothetical protein J07HX64_02690 [halophilic archaeon J07HX64]